ncbi:MAG: ParB/RepB/Spo0J family partition protein [Parcubacteria group bacterium]|nr:ParB/RepB/Spo0J family partition protein [Parcubacteria group bacterium]
MDNKDLTLIVLAAGMGSRYGGLKQIDPIGPNGEIIIDYSLYDAKLAGFNKIVFVIRKDIEEVFKNRIGKQAEKDFQVFYVFQELNKGLPIWFKLSQERKKPWGTGQAILLCKDEISSNFAIINSDDFYGRDAFIKMANALKNLSDEENLYHYLMVGYLLKNTLSEFGSVSRGVCETLEQKYLKDIKERTKIQKFDDGIKYEENGNWYSLSGEEIVSMNFFGFTPSIFYELETRFYRFLMNINNPEKDEFYIPEVVGQLIRENKAKVEILPTEASWFGVTYPKDKELVKHKIEELINQNIYPKDLYKKEADLTNNTNNTNLDPIAISSLMTSAPTFLLDNEKEILPINNNEELINNEEKNEDEYDNKNLEIEENKIIDEKIKEEIEEIKEKDYEKNLVEKPLKKVEEKIENNENKEDFFYKEKINKELGPIKDAVYLIEVEKIKPNPYQPRRNFDEESLKELANSIKEFGILQPLIVSRVEKETPYGQTVEYQLIAGERRLRAAQLIGLEKVPVIIRPSLEERQKLEAAIIENIQRTDLSPLETARSFAKLAEEFGLSQREIAERVGKSRAYIANTLRLLELPSEAQKALEEGKITESHARLILSIENPEKKRALLGEILSRRLTVRETEILTKRILEMPLGVFVSQKQETSVSDLGDALEKEIEKKLEEIFGTKVEVKKHGDKGKITINFFSDEELEEILKKLVKE